MSNVANFDGTDYTAPTETSFTDELMAGAKAPILADSELLTAPAAFKAACVYGAAGFVIGSKIGRKRQSEGKAPWMGIAG